MRYITLCILLDFCFFSHAQESVPLEQLLQQSERRQAVIDEELTPSADGRIPVKITVAPLPQERADNHCFSVHVLQVESVDQSKIPIAFLRYLSSILEGESIVVKKQSRTTYQLFSSTRQTTKQAAKAAPCLTATKIERITTKLQNRLVEKGYITSRILIPEQNLSQGLLKLGISVGRTGELQVDKKATLSTHAHRATLVNAFPTGSGKALNLRDLEQGLENLRRLPTVKAEMDIVPGTQVNHSDIVVKWQQRAIPFRLSFSIDDSGNESTGKYLGTIGFSWDNPLLLNDTFSISYTKNLQSGTRYTDPNGQTDQGKTHNYAVNYQVPFGYWQLAMGISEYHYDQVVAGINRNYHYTGDSQQGHVNLSRVLYRDDQHKFTASLGAWHKTTRSYIDDVELDVQRRHTGGWKASLAQRSYFQRGTLSSTLTYQRGTRAFGATPAPEELFDEGTGKMKIWTADIHWQMPFKLGQTSWSWYSNIHAQWNKTRLTAQDKISIGGRYSVRGFSGKRTLLAERGWYVRNDLAWHYQPGHQVYLGLDTGYVSGESAENLLGQSLSGVALGLKGYAIKNGQWSYDAFIAAPLDYPKYFPTDSVTAGFKLSYNY